MAFDTTYKEVSDDKIEVYLNDKLLFATVYTVSPSRAKVNHKWTFRLENLPVESSYVIYKSAALAIIEVEKYINLLNRSL